VLYLLNVVGRKSLVHDAAIYVNDTSGKKNLLSNSNTAQYYGLRLDGTRTGLAGPCIPPANVRL
jgi:hypothetical protein